jgi:hypothetical protein
MDKVCVVVAAQRTDRIPFTIYFRIFMHKELILKSSL